ncbi:VgrG-related protein [Micromonospora sp. HK10]|uniref:VgrG-related protein n=1 Tax=Micromonospora sp. HK10 TaxID=1538294 RepID=UPI000626F4CE|nr:VgrG-related protein [Micromonospora sp. HK10]KKJ93158.1 type IV secretion protein Rhs [Micromonospora sp. HK10]
MANEQFANALLVEVGGSPLPAEIASLLTYAAVDDSRNLPDRFVLRYRDPDRSVLAKGGFAIGVPVRLTVQTSDPGGPAPLLRGEVTALECELDATGTFTEIRGLDLAHRLLRGRRVAAYPGMSVPDIVRKVAQRAGLKAGRIDPVAGIGGEPEAQLSQDNVSDWAFLHRLAELVGAQVTVRDGELHLRMPEPPIGAPDPSARASQDPLVLEVNRNLIALRAGVTATAQVPEVGARGWDPATKRAVSATATPTVPGADGIGVDPAELGRTLGSPAYLVADPTLGTDAAVRTVAGALAGDLGGGCAEIEGVAKGNARLRAGAAVALANVGAPFQGRYVLTSTRHVFSEQAGYTTAFTVSGRSDRSLYGLATGGSAAEPAGRGLVPAVVSDVKDPKKLGRVRLTLPWLDGTYTTGWARVVQPGAGADRGTVLLPEVGDEVLVGFTGGNLDAAYVLGGLHNGTDAPPKLDTDPVDAGTGRIAARALVSRTGHRLELLEAGSGPDGILLATGDRKFTVRLDRTGRRIEIVSDGKVSVQAREGISLDAGTGPLELAGQRVTVTSKSDVAIEGQGQVSVRGTGGVAVEGATVKVAGQGGAELTASGPVTVRGAVVRIN